MEIFISRVEGKDSCEIVVEAESLDLADEQAREYFTNQGLVEVGDTVHTTRLLRTA